MQIKIGWLDCKSEDADLHLSAHNKTRLSDNMSEFIPYVKAKLFQMDKLGRIFLVQS